VAPFAVSLLNGCVCGAERAGLERLGVGISVSIALCETRVVIEAFFGEPGDLAASLVAS